MPSSPITKTINSLPENYKELEKIVLPHEETAHYYRVWFEGGSPIERPMAWLMCCYIEDDVTDEERWYHVEEMDEIRHTSILDTIKSVFGVSFHDKIGV